MPMARPDRTARTALRALIAALAVSLATPLPAQAQSVPCGGGAGLIAHLEKEWGEDPAVIAIDAGGGLVRILANPDTGTWTLLITRPGGLTCLVASGTAWEPIPSSFDRLRMREPEPGDPS